MVLHPGKVSSSCFPYVLLLRELEGDSVETVQEMREENNLYPDPSDRATSETEHINLLRIRDRERKLMSKIDEAHRKIEQG